MLGRMNKKISLGLFIQSYIAVTTICEQRCLGMLSVNLNKQESWSFSEMQY